MHRIDRAEFWLSGVIAAAAGLVITFWSDHSPAAGALVFGCFALALGLTRALLVRPGRAELRLLAALTAGWHLAAGALALLLPLPSVGLAGLLAVWALGVAGFAALAWRRERAATGTRGFLALLSALFGLAVIPAAGNSVVVVGLLGAYLVIAAVWQLIAAAGPRESLPTPIAGAPDAPSAH